jgi:hypothetical protein
VDYGKIREGVEKAISEGAGFVTGWVLVAEHLDSDGDRALLRITPDNSVVTLWAEIGMLETAAAHAKDMANNAFVPEEDDDA